MEIKVARIKATKSLVNQFQHATVEALAHGNVLGFVRDVVKGESSTILIELRGNYYREGIYDWHFLTGGVKGCLYRKGIFFRKFKSEEDAKEWLCAYNLAKASDGALTHIFV